MGSRCLDWVNDEVSYCIDGLRGKDEKRLMVSGKGGPWRLKNKEKTFQHALESAVIGALAEFLEGLK